MGVAHYNEHDEDIDVAIVLKRQALWVHETDIGERSESSGATSNAMKVAGGSYLLTVLVRVWEIRALGCLHILFQNLSQ